MIVRLADQIEHSGLLLARRGDPAACLRVTATTPTRDFAVPERVGEWAELERRMKLVERAATALEAARAAVEAAP